MKPKLRLFNLNASHTSFMTCILLDYCGFGLLKEDYEQQCKTLGILYKMVKVMEGTKSTLLL